MTLASPLFLLLLIPFAGLVIYLLAGRRTVTDVPFVQLWQHLRGSPRIERSFQLPPTPILLVLLAIFLSILAAAGIRIRSIPEYHHVSIVVDNGATMLPPGRMEGVIQRCADFLKQSFPFTEITLVKAVGDDVITTDASDLQSLHNRIVSYPVDTEAQLESRIARRLQESDAPVIVLSDRKLKSTRSRVVQVSPEGEVANVGIVDVAVRDWPLGQLMLKLRNESNLAQADCEIRTGNIVIERRIDLPASGDTKDLFFDLAEVGPEIRLALRVADEFAMDNTAVLIRTGANASVEIRGAVDPAVRRIVDVYTRHRPAVSGGERVVVTDSLFQLPTARAVAVASSATNLAPLRGTIQVEMDHPILRNIDWGPIDQATVAGTSPGDGWTPIVRANDLVLFAVREKPFRQVWIGFNSPAFEGTRDFVILWANLLDYLGEGGASIGYERIASLSPGTLPPREPGIYQRSDGSHMAMNLVDVRFEPQPALLTRFPESLPIAPRSRGFNLSPLLVLLASGCVLAGVVVLAFRPR